MVEENIIKNTNREEFVYAITLLLEKWITILTILIISVICSRLCPTIIFLISFFLLRKYTGGYHAKSFWQCYFTTIFTYLALIMSDALIIANQNIMFILLTGSVIVIIFFGTINHPNMDMNIKEITASKKVARLLVVTEVSFIWFAWKVGVNIIYIVYISCAIILCAALLCISKLLNQEVNRI